MLTCHVHACHVDASHMHACHVPACHVYACHVYVFQVIWMHVKSFRCISLSHFHASHAHTSPSHPSAPSSTSIPTYIHTHHSACVRPAYTVCKMQGDTRGIAHQVDIGNEVGAGSVGMHCKPWCLASCPRKRGYALHCIGSVGMQWRHAGVQAWRGLHLCVVRERGLRRERERTKADTGCVVRERHLCVVRERGLRQTQALGLNAQYLPALYGKANILAHVCCDALDGSYSYGRRAQEKQVQELYHHMLMLHPASALAHAAAGHFSQHVSRSLSLSLPSVSLSRCHQSRSLSVVLA